MRSATKVQPAVDSEFPPLALVGQPQLVHSRSQKLSTAAFVTLVLAVVGMTAATVWERITLRNEMRLALDHNAQELEALRADVVTASSENTAFLKILILHPGIDKQLARDIAHSIVVRAREHRRDPDLVLALIDVESDFNPHAVSPMGAIGLMQIMPSWKGTLGIERDMRDVDTNIVAGLTILNSYEQMFGGLELALTAYNKGPTQVASDMKRGKPPFNGYSEAIMRTYARIKAWMRP